MGKRNLAAGQGENPPQFRVQAPGEGHQFIFVHSIDHRRPFPSICLTHYNNFFFFFAGEKVLAKHRISTFAMTKAGRYQTGRVYGF